jgi:hypothetical protein
MSNKNEPMTQAVQKRVNLTAAAKQIDEIARGAVDLFKDAGSFEAEIAVAQTMADMRSLLTPDVMQPIMALMNTDLGFRTDRDPKVTPKDKDGNPLQPYSMEIVRDAVIEAKLRGFHIVGNEINIIAGRFYACKNGFRRKVTTGKGVTDFRDTYDVPRLVGDKGAIVKCKATWRKEGTEQSLEREFPIRVNAGMGSDAILGKCQRKLLAAVHDRLQGIVTPEGEANEEVIDVPGATQKPTPKFGEAAQPAAPTPAADQPAKQ